MLIHNINELSDQAELDQCGDETSIGHAGYAEPGSGISSRIMNKPGITKGMQTVIISDVHRNRPRAYLHRHKLHEDFPRHREECWTATAGGREVRRILDALKPLVVSETSDGRRQIFSSKPHSTWDNYFSHDCIMDWCGKNKFPMLCTVQRGRLPKNVPAKFMHKGKVDPHDRRAKVARMLEPITMVKECKDGDEAYTKVHVTFQSTGATNLQCVNSLNRNKRFVKKKERGQSPHKRKWVIEMNDARQLYLSSYGRIDTIDAQIRRCNLNYVSWKYWHACKLHCDALALVMAYDMYIECATEEEPRKYFSISKEDKLEVLDFHDFRTRVAQGGLQYNVTNCKYPGDEKMRNNTRLSKKRRSSTKNKSMVKNADGTISKRARGRPAKDQMVINRATQEMYDNARGSSNRGRLCGDLTMLEYHNSKMEKTGAEHICVVCGEVCIARCAACPGKPYMHYQVVRGKCKGKPCFFNYHNSSKFGLLRNDRMLFGQSRTNWKPPSASQLRENRRIITALEKGYCMDIN